MSSRFIEREIDIEAPIDLVWSALTDPDELAGWFVEEARLDPVPGGDGRFVFGGRATNQGSDAAQVGVRLHVVAAEPPHRFVYRWAHPEGAEAAEGNSLLVEFTLVEVGDGTRLRVVEHGFDDYQPVDDRDAHYRSHQEGWARHLGDLRTYASERVAGARR